MAKVKKNIMMRGLSGSLGPDHYARVTKDGRTIISGKPDFSNRRFSEGQLNVQRSMKQAAAYAKGAKDNPIYQKKAAGTALNSYNVALRDWFHAPVIRSIFYEQGLIRVSASDDVLVAGVTVSILDENGGRLEQGQAELTLGVWWDYCATHSGRIRVEACDLAGNVTSQEISPPSQPFFLWEKDNDPTKNIHL